MITRINHMIRLERMGVNFRTLAKALYTLAQKYEKLENSLVELRAADRRHYIDFSSLKNRSSSKINAGGTFDVVLFWKQSDSGLYGRRSDMMMKYLLSSGKVGRILHFDAPLSVSEVVKGLENSHHTVNEVAPLTLRKTLARWMKALDTEHYLSRQFIYRHEGYHSLYGQSLPEKESYCDWVIEQIKIAGINLAHTVAWVYPVVWDFSTIAARVPFQNIIIDLVDDQRTWKLSIPQISHLEANYREVLTLGDVIFANCHSLAQTFQKYVESKTIHVIPNGAECFDKRFPYLIPQELVDLPHPIIGYVGYLYDRIDWVMLTEMVKLRPDWSFVFIGAGQEIVQAKLLARFKNVKFLGVVEYAELPRYLHAFDVAIIPHEDNAQTKRMNPLKIYNYFSAGLPIVTTDIANIDEIRPFLHIARNSQAFIAAIETTLQEHPENQSDREQLIKHIRWDMRVAKILEIIQPLLNLHEVSSDNTRQVEQLEKNCLETEREKALVLKQLFQVQEELEYYFLLHERQKKQITQLEKEMAEQKKSDTEFQVQFKQLKACLEKRDIRINQLEADIVEKNAQRSLLSTELSKTKVQIDRIKKLLSIEV